MHAACALSAGQDRTHFAQAVASRQRIGEAVGILAERHGMDTTAAFTLLSRVSQNHNIKVRDLAERLVATVDSQDHP